MSVNCQLVAIPASDAEWMLAAGGGQRLQDYEPPDDGELWVEGYWHGLHYLFSGTSEERPGPGPLGQVIFSRHQLTVPGPPPDAPFWLVTPSEADEVAAALRDRDRNLIARRYHDIADGMVEINWQTAYEHGQTRTKVFDYIDAIAALYDRTVAAGGGVLNLIA